MKAALSVLLLSSLVSACGPSFKTTKGDLAMKTYQKAPDAPAVVLERSGLAILDYSQELDDTTMFKAWGKPTGGGGMAARPGTADGGSPVDSVKKDSADLIRNAGVSSYTLEVVNRVKIFDEAGLDAAKVEIDLPANAKVESLAAATFLPDGSKIELDTSKVDTSGGTISFEMPGAKVGAVLEYQYKYFSDNLGSLDGWTFQQDKPVANSVFKIKMRPGTSFPYRFVKTSDAQDPNPEEERVLGMDEKESVILKWDLKDLPPTPQGQNPAALLIGD